MANKKNFIKGFITETLQSMDSEAERINQAGDLTIITSYTTEDDQEAKEDISDVLNKNLDALAIEGAKEVQRRTLRRFAASRPGPLVTAAGETSGQRLESKLSAIRAGIAGKPRRLSQAGSAGFAARGELDKILIDEGRSSKVTSKLPKGQNNEARDHAFEQKGGAVKGGGIVTPSRSQFNKAWMIAEFGTGIFAPEKFNIIRKEGPTKVKGGGGKWYLQPKHKSGIIYGQRGGHFLFGLRQNTESVRADIDAATEAIMNKFEELLK